MNRKTLDGDEQKEKIPSSKVRPSRFYGGSVALSALAALRGVRHCGNGKLGLREAISKALEQGAAFKRWREKGTLVRRVQVWVEDQLVMTVSPGDNSVKLKAFNFVVPSPRDAVMRVLKADEGEEKVVLRNLPLNTVPCRGLDETTSLPNGQRIRLMIIPKDAGRFDIKVAFAPEEEDSMLEDATPVQAMRARAGAESTSGRPWDYVPTLLSQTKVSYGALTCAAVIFALVVTAGATAFRSLMNRHPFQVTIVSQKEHSASNLGEETSAAVEVSAASGSTPKPVGERYKVTVKYGGGEIDVPGSPLFGEDSACPASFEQKRAVKKPALIAGAQTETAKLQPVTPGFGKIGPDKGNKIGDASELEVLTPLNREAQALLSDVQYVDVTVDDTSPSSATELRTLHTSFVRVLSGSSAWAVWNPVEKSSPDAVISLRFEPDQSCLGVVFVEIRGPDSDRVLWRARVGCRAIRKSDHDAMFADASARLIAKLQEKLNTNQEPDGER